MSIERQPHGRPYFCPPDTFGGDTNDGSGGTGRNRPDGEQASRPASETASGTDTPGVRATGQLQDFPGEEIGGTTDWDRHLIAARASGATPIRIREASSLVDGVTRAITGSIDDRITQCIGLVAGCEQCVQAAIGVGLDRASEICRKSEVRVAQQISRQIGQGYKAVSSLGLQPPSTQQLLGDLQLSPDAPLSEQVPTLCEDVNPFPPGSEYWRDWQERCCQKFYITHPDGYKEDIWKCPSDKQSQLPTYAKLQPQPSEEPQQPTYLTVNGYPPPQPPQPIPPLPPLPPLPPIPGECPAPEVYCQPEVNVNVDLSKIRIPECPATQQTITGPVTNITYEDNRTYDNSDRRKVDTRIGDINFREGDENYFLEDNRRGGDTTTYNIETGVRYDTNEQTITLTNVIIRLVNELIEQNRITIVEYKDDSEKVTVHINEGDYQVSTTGGPIITISDSSSADSITTGGDILTLNLGQIAPTPSVDTSKIDTTQPLVVQLSGCVQTCADSKGAAEEDRPLPSTVAALYDLARESTDLDNLRHIFETIKDYITREQRESIESRIKELEKESLIKEKETEKIKDVLVEVNIGGVKVLRPARDVIEPYKLLRGIALPEWSDPKFCEAVAKITETLVANPQHAISYLFGTKDRSGKILLPDWLAKIYNLLLGLDKGTVGDLVRGLIDSFSWIMGNIPLPNNCKIDRVMAPMFIKMIIGIVQKWTGADIEWLKVPYDYMQGSMCPTLLPTMDNAHEMRIKNKITQEQWECLVKANNGIVDWQKKLLRSRQEFLSPYDVVRLHWRGTIGDNNYKEYLRDAGYPDWYPQIFIERLMEPVPGPQDIIRFMLRDVEDKNVYERFGYDEGFKLKLGEEGSQMRKWMKSNGIPESQLLYYWRASREIPSPTQLFQMVRLLRPGKAGIGENLQVTPDDARAALIAADYPTFWVERILASLYLPLTRVDVRRAFNIGLLSSQEVVSAYQDLGYNRGNAERQARFAAIDRIRSLRSNPWVRLFRQNGISETEFRERVAKEGMDSSTQDEAIAIARVEKRAEMRKKCLAALKKRYMLGELSDNEIQGLIEGQGVEVEDAMLLATQWHCEKMARVKEFTLKKLSDWCISGVIDETQFLRRLLRLGYSLEDAELLVRDCGKAASNAEEKKKAGEERQQEARRIMEELGNELLGVRARRRLAREARERSNGAASETS